MKTFEERYTAWIDHRLEGAALAAFEQELARRSGPDEARADRAEAGRLRSLLLEHLRAPELGNAEFFSLQVRQRIDAEREAAAPKAAAGGREWPALFAWPVTRLLGAGGACLFVAAALYYGLMPPRLGAPAPGLARSSASPLPARQATELAAAKPALPAWRIPRPGDDLMARNDAPKQPAIDDPAPDLAATVPAAAGTSTTATPLHYKDQNVNVLWINGLDYMPTVPAADVPPANGPGAAP